MIALMGVSLASGQYWYSESSATGWDTVSNGPITNTQTSEIEGLAAYAAAGNRLQTEALADAHPQAAPTSQSRASSILDQSDPANGVLRQFSESRAIYFGSETYPVRSMTKIIATYGLRVENLAGIPLNIVFGNHIQGVMARYEEGLVRIEESTNISGFNGFNASAYVDRFDARGTGAWEHALFSQTYQDPYLGSIPGFRLNSLQFYGSRSFAPGESDVMNVSHIFEVTTRLQNGGFRNGMAVGDFTGTADLTIRAYDSLGNDRTSDIRLSYAPVPEPITIVGLGAAAIGLAMRRRKASTGSKAT